MFPYVYEINAAGWVYLFYIGLVIPFFSVRQARKFHGGETPMPARLRHLHRTAATLVMFGGMSLVVAWAQRMDLFPRAFPPWRGIGAGLLMYIIAVIAMRPRWKRAVARRVRVVHLFMPSNRTERAWWVTVSILAGVCEEITWRGVQAGLAYRLLGSFWIAALCCAIPFGVSHMVQGWKSAAIISVFAMGFHLLVWLSGSLYVAMMVHFLYDITAGISYGKLGRDLGYSLEDPIESPGVV